MANAPLLTPSETQDLTKAVTTPKTEAKSAAPGSAQRPPEAPSETIAFSKDSSAMNENSTQKPSSKPRKTVAKSPAKRSKVVSSAAGVGKKKAVKKKSPVGKAAGKVKAKTPVKKVAAKATKDRKLAKKKGEQLKDSKKVKPKKKAKLVRDSFTMPESEYDLFAKLKKRCLAKGLSVTKSEVLRAALIRLAAQADDSVISAIKAVEVLKTGRPPKAQKHGK
jgi:hypothetical protein